MLALDTDVLVHWTMEGAPHHHEVRQLLELEVREHGHRIALLPQVCWEFLHVVTDVRRFADPLTMEQALSRVRDLWGAPETVRLQPGPAVVHRVLELMRENKLGRKRILDTVLAATLEGAGTRRLATLNVDDFRIFTFLEVVDPRRR